MSNPDYLALVARQREFFVFGAPFDKIACKVKSWLSQLYVSRPRP
jgi:hypothetical protein